ncbi:MAG: zinc ribbon domain-containing protein [Acidilobaceae archaeon]
MSNIDYKAYERGLNTIEDDTKRTSITCPSCRSVDKENMIDNKFKCKRCGFELNPHHVAYLNIFSHLNDC